MAFFSEGFPSGQRDQTVNLTAQPSEVRILPPPPVVCVETDKCGCSSMVELQPSKLIVWVRFPSPAPRMRAAGRVKAHIAQAVEHFLGKEEVAGSIPVVGTIYILNK